jgi:class 3 adenylate cyclase/tetratricopeptide (TPR) repeat protein
VDEPAQFFEEDAGGCVLALEGLDPVEPGQYCAGFVHVTDVSRGNRAALHRKCDYFTLLSMPACPKCGEDNPERARFCWSCGSALADAAPSAGEERKVVSILFVDLVGFTSSSEQADPEDVRARLRTYHARVKQEIERFGGTVEKFIGDAVMAVFGAPATHEDDPERAVNAALRVIAAVDELDGLSVRAAINTGEAVVTLGARPAEGEAMVAGDVVNTAARLQQHAPVNGVVVGEATYRATRDLFEYEALEPVTAKGKTEPLALWHAKAARRRFGVDVEPIARTPFIGRDDDLALLQTTFARTLRESSTQLVTITGEPGVGKTRLAAEFRRWVDEQPDLVFWRQGRSLPYGEGITYWALGEMVKAQAGILESDSSEEARAKLAVAVAEASPDEAERDWLSKSLAPLVGAAAGDTPAATAETSYAAWQRFLEGVAAQRPLVVVFEDLHWADEQLLGFIEHLVDWSTGVPLLVLCTARPELYEQAPGWGGGKRNSNTISLSPLGPENTARLLAALLDRAVLPAETQARLIEHAGGNPLYAEEFVRMLADRGLLTPEGELRAGEISVPGNVQALIAARLDTLASERKALLHDAAVVGKVFWSGAVAAMGGLDEPHVRAGLQELVRKELVRAVRESSVRDQVEYAFWHALVRDVAYAQIPRSARARKHVAAAEWIERMAGERVTDHAELLAHHYESALELARATDSGGNLEPLVESARRFLELAGDRAASLDLAKAFGYYSRAAALYAENDTRRAQLLVKALHRSPGSVEQGGRFAEDAVAIFRAAGDEVGEGDAQIALAGVAWTRGDTARADRLQVEAIEKLERHPPGRELLNAYSRRAGSLSIAGRSREALAVVKQALLLHEQLQPDVPPARLYQFRGIALCNLGDASGLDDVRKGLELALAAGDLVVAGIGYSNLASNLHDYSAREALDVWTEGIDFTTKRGITVNGFWQLAESTWALFDLGRWDEVVARATEVVEWSEARGLSYAGAIAAAQHARVLLYRGDLAGAAALLDRWFPAAREAGDPQVVVHALGVSAELEAARDDLGAALGLVREVEERTRTGAVVYRAIYLPNLVSIALAAGAPEVATALLDAEYGQVARVAAAVVTARAVAAEAGEMFEDALTLYADAEARWADYGFVLGRADALHGAGRTLMALARDPHAQLRAARELYAQLGAQPAVERVDEALAEATSRSA